MLNDITSNKNPTACLLYIIRVTCVMSTKETSKAYWSHFFFIYLSLYVSYPHT